MVNSAYGRSTAVFNSINSRPRVAIDEKISLIAQSWNIFSRKVRLAASRAPLCVLHRAPDSVVPLPSSLGSILLFCSCVPLRLSVHSLLSLTSRLT